MRLLLLLIALPLAAAEGDEARWNLADIFSDQASWQAAKARAAADLDKISACEGDLTANARRLEECLDLIYGLQKEVVRVYSYASMLSDEDTQVSENAQMRAEAQLLFAEFGKKTSFVSPKIIAAGEAAIQDFIASNSGLEQYRYPLREILRQAPHTRSEEVEAAIAEIGPLASAPGDIYRTLANAEVPWPTVKLSTGEEVRLDQSGYVAARAAQSREDRKLVFEKFWSTWRDYERTMGESLYGQMKGDRMFARLRNYSSSLGAALSEDNLPETVYRTLVRVTNENLDTLHRYFKLRGRILGIDDLAYYDIYPPLILEAPKFSREQGVDLALAAGALLGDEYVDVMQRGFRERWIDWLPRKGKRSGAYMNGSVYDVHPYLLLNYNSTYDSVSTLAHEYGHAVHSALATAAQPYPTSDYAIFVAEVASTANENILLDHMLEQAKTDDERLFYLGHDLESIRGTFFRQTMFAEFELRAHDLVDAGEALTGKRFTEIYEDLLRKYHGADEGVMEIDSLYAVEWAFIPHFYRNFYVFQYATSISAAAQLSKAILENEPGAKERYLDLLKAGGSDDPIELLKKAGIDMTTPAPYEALVARANRVMDEIEKILDKREGGRPTGGAAN